MTLDEFRRHPAYDYYIISVPCDIADESEEYIQSLLTYDNYKDLEYIRKDNEFYFYLKTYSNE